MFVFFMLASCDKGYRVRFRNFSTSVMDSVIIGDMQVVFTNVETQTTTDYVNITRGNHGVTFVPKSKKRVYSYMKIPSKGEGDKTLQIDAINQVATLDE